jgi:hypothetical protein
MTTAVVMRRTDFSPMFFLPLIVDRTSRFHAGPRILARLSGPGPRPGGVSFIPAFAGVTMKGQGVYLF